MSSSVFYKFKNSKELERIVFDGTGISVFELKRAIILANGMAKDTDFNLHLYHEDEPTTEYDDDTEIILRSSVVIASRRPAARGFGRAARYISGNAPVRAIKKGTTKTVVAPSSGGSLSEQDAEARFLQESAQVWDQQKETLAHQKPVYQKKKLNVPTHEPPPGYVCYRCGNKGHWIQACPTNDDPDFKPTARAKRSTGIPRSFLQKVELPDGDLEGARGVMLNADGEYVQVMTDTKTWEKFQEKAKAAKAKEADAAVAIKEARERGLVCPVDNCIFVNPTKISCCGTKTYCHDCIENALVDGDLICPDCGEDVLLDDLVPDEDMVEKVRAYEADKAKEKLEKEQQVKEDAKPDAKLDEKSDAKPLSPSHNETQVSVPNPTDKGSSSPKPTSIKNPIIVAANLTSSATPGAADGSDTDTSTTSKKRKEAPTDIIAPTAPKAMRLQQEQQTRPTPDQTMEQNFIQSMEALKNMPAMMPMAMPMGMGMQNPMMTAPPMNAYGQMNGANWGGYNNAGYPMMNGGFNNMGYGNGGYPQYPNQAGNSQNFGYQAQPNQFPPFQMQQQPLQEDAYERKPVNPRNKRKQRAPDYRYL
jgi:protein MPE1